MASNSERKYQYYKSMYIKYKNLYDLLTPDTILSNSQIEEIRNENLHTLDFWNICCMTFDWKVPKNIPKRRVEMNLFKYGKVAFIHDEINGDFILPFAYAKGLNVYGDYRFIQPIVLGDNINILSKQEYEIDKECVIIRDNNLEIPPLAYARYYANRIAELFRVRDKNNNYLKLPFIFSSTGDRGKDKKNAFEIQQVLGADNNEIAVISDAFNMLKFFDLKPQYFGREIAEQLKDLKNEFYLWCGLKHLPYEKRERMVVDEVNIENEVTNVHTQKRLSPRKEACEKINELFKVDISVKVNEFDDEIAKTSNIVASVAGGIHNDNTRNQERTKRD